MAIQVLKCVNCGAKLEKNNNGELFCPCCGFSYSEKDEINNTYITHRENVIKNFYGSAVKQGLDSETIKGYELRIIDAFKNDNLSEARNYCLCIILNSPLNKRAIATKSFIENILRKPDGRYKHLDIYAVFDFVNELCADDEIGSYINIFDLAQALIETVETEPKVTILSLFDKAIADVTALNNPYTTGFLNALSRRKLSAKLAYEMLVTEEKTQKIIEETERQKQIKEDARKKGKIIAGIVIGIIIICIFLIVKYT